MVLIKMSDSQAHPLLAQVPLTVSPFVQLPTAITLPYHYKTLPSSLPPSSTGLTTSDPSAQHEKPQFVVSASGHASHPDDILRDLKALHERIDGMMADADKEIQEWEDRIKARELAEKRRVAPGWLDSEVRVLEPAKKDDGKGKGPSIMDSEASSAEASRLGESLVDKVERDGEMMDKAFGGLDLR